MLAAWLIKHAARQATVSWANIPLGWCRVANKPPAIQRVTPSPDKHTHEPDCGRNYFHEIFKLARSPALLKGYYV